ncbi:MAG: hypothetical protein AAGF24_13025 [Cyanobacteria bacterium P01_H01_bin.121]
MSKQLSNQLTKHRWQQLNQGIRTGALSAALGTSLSVLAVSVAVQPAIAQTNSSADLLDASTSADREQGVSLNNAMDIFHQLNLSPGNAAEAYQRRQQNIDSEAARWRELQRQNTQPTVPVAQPTTPATGEPIVGPTDVSVPAE